MSQVYKWNGYTFNNVSSVLGLKEKSKYVYDCSIRDSSHNTLEVVLIFANNFGEARWCMMGYLQAPLLCSDTEQSDVKQFLPSKDANCRNFYVHVVRCD